MPSHCPPREDPIDANVDAARVALVGCGSVATDYLKTFSSVGLEVAACVDVVPERAEQLARQHQIPAVTTLTGLTQDPAVDLVVNLTPPRAHTRVTRRLLAAGKPVYSEKPLATSYREAVALVELAERRQVPLGCSPDTFLGARLQQARRMIDSGAIGPPVGAVATMLSHGHERWHPRPEMFYQAGGGPLFDVGPYWLTMLVHLFGPVSLATGVARATSPVRTVPSDVGPARKIPVDVPTHVLGGLHFKTGPTAVLLASFDVWASRLPALEVHGSEGSLCLPDPLQLFQGSILLRRAGEREWSVLQPAGPPGWEGRGVGVVEMLANLAAPRAGAQVATHVVEVIEATLRSSEVGEHVAVASTCTAPDLLPWFSGDRR